MNNRVEPQDDDYNALWNRWQSDGGAHFNFRGQEWMVVKDGDHEVFVKVGSESGISEKYDSSSIPNG